MKLLDIIDNDVRLGLRTHGICIFVIKLFTSSLSNTMSDVQSSWASWTILIPISRTKVERYFLKTFCALHKSNDGQNEWNLFHIWCVCVRIDRCKIIPHLVIICLAPVLSDRMKKVYTSNVNIAYYPLNSPTSLSRYHMHAFTIARSRPPPSLMHTEEKLWFCDIFE